MLHVYTPPRWPAALFCAPKPAPDQNKVDKAPSSKTGWKDTIPKGTGTGNA